MKRILTLTLCLALLLCHSSLANGLFPAYTDLFGLEMPSMSAVLLRSADEVQTGADGSRTVVFNGVSEADFEAFSEYMESFGCALKDYTVEGSVFEAEIAKQGKSFIFRYDMAELVCKLTYPLGVMEEDEDAVIQKFGIQIGGLYTFGHYEQDDDPSNGPEPIEWIVLDKRDDGSLVLLSKCALDAKPYNAEYVSVTWETCTLRAWLNGDFYDAAFSAEEQAKILPVTLENENNPKSGAPGGKDTKDKVWLLSVNEVTDVYSTEKVYSCFIDDASRICAPTQYAVAQGELTSGDYNFVERDACWWWLRTSGNGSWHALYVDYDGYIDSYGDDVIDDLTGVRPVVVVHP